MKKSENSLVKYNSYETFPAKVFFEVRDSKDYQLMRPKPSVTAEELKDMFDAVYDVYFEKLDSETAKRYIQIRDSIGIMTFTIESIKAILFFVATIPENIYNHPEVKAIRDSQLTALNELLETPIDLNIDMLDELERVLNVEIGIISDEISILKSEKESLDKETHEVIFDYYAEIVALEEAHGRTLDEKMMLPKYVELVKLGIKKAEIIKQQNIKRNGKT